MAQAVVRPTFFLVRHVPSANSATPPMSASLMCPSSFNNTLQGWFEMITRRDGRTGKGHTRTADHEAIYGVMRVDPESRLLASRLKLSSYSGLGQGAAPGCFDTYLKVTPNKKLNARRRCNPPRPFLAVSPLSPPLNPCTSARGRADAPAPILSLLCRIVREQR